MGPAMPPYTPEPEMNRRRVPFSAAMRCFWASSVGSFLKPAGRLTGMLSIDALRSHTKDG